MATTHLDHPPKEQGIPEAAPMPAFDPVVGPELPVELLAAAEGRQSRATRGTQEARKLTERDGSIR